MQIFNSIESIRAWRAQHTDVAFVPTMGNLHGGHLALVAQAQRRARHVVVSIFVNPLQFGINEDYSRYPRTLDKDAEALEKLGVDVLFAPNVETLFPEPQRYHIELPAVCDTLCGASRPGHFRGVATIVMKLLHIVQPDAAIFGKKDYQQWVIIRGMVADFSLPVEIMAGETVRADDGLALSSRNGFLSETDRKLAPQLYATLNAIKSQLAQGNHHYNELETSAAQMLVNQGWRVDYVAIRNPDLTLPDQHSKQWVVLAAAHLGNTRLIDNIESETGAFI